MRVAIIVFACSSNDFHSRNILNIVDAKLLSQLHAIPEQLSSIVQDQWKILPRSPMTDTKFEACGFFHRVELITSEKNEAIVNAAAFLNVVFDLLTEQNDLFCI